MEQNIQCQIVHISKQFLPLNYSGKYVQQLGAKEYGAFVTGASQNVYSYKYEDCKSQRLWNYRLMTMSFDSKAFTLPTEPTKIPSTIRI